ncbi:MULTISPECIES: N-acetylmuramoyl-L-alanine amidase [Bacillaceae]|uniref:N-acetylmuramoyl-L-alanine amidase n=1 Tax=Bacillaceae TaxID=186817 RepID=UPI001E5CCB34|nr:MULTISPECIES: N-acetylmuramoyl-L-alanine amidase [Bacillaceae]MCE4046964.1 N-acetylmuramoyl-L-alanine amidase [Bacillus sp. Au-Bac7]MDL0436516.1 N-acetylmuramoyl-L-alanine amidase [Niallia sp. SS-2023]UPO86648.1 N-acetylmuramoyl-L-alanine amidase [Niallia sp. Man26]
MAKIFIDPGHGGSDPGAVGNGIQEKDITLRIATMIRDMLVSEYEDVTVRMSRTSDETVSLSERSNAANAWGADYFVSVHVNAGGGIGFESYVYTGVGAPTTTYQTAIHNRIINLSNWSDRGKKKANFHVLRETNMPAILTENGFIDNATDANKLKSASFLSTLARGHAEGIADAFNLNKKDTGGGGSGDLYKVQIGAFRNKENADSLAEQARRDGLEAAVLFRDNLYKVQIGAFANRANAEAMEDRAKDAGYATIILTES